MTDQMEKECPIIINDHLLPTNLSRTIRVAMHHFYMDMLSKQNGEDCVGRKLSEIYISDAKEIMDIIINGCC